MVLERDNILNPPSADKTITSEFFLAFRGRDAFAPMVCAFGGSDASVPMGDSEIYKKTPEGGSGVKYFSGDGPDS